jgi:hypothetical protein
MNYRFKRRSFLAGIGGAFGIRILLDNLEAMAQGATSPPRFLLTHWPTGTVRYQFVPTGTGTSYVTSRILRPFETKGLRAETIALYGLSQTGMQSLGGSHESGTVFSTTGANSPGTRANGGQTDDSVAGGPSWDQILLKHVPALAHRLATGEIVGPGTVNASCDARVDSYETSTQCLSYSYTTRAIPSASPGTTITENIPVLPELEPSRLYANLFSGFMPGGNGGAALRALKMRKSVLDSALRELARVHDLAPAAERPKIELHTEAIRKIEQGLADQIAGGGSECMAALTVPTYPTEGRIGLRNNWYGDPRADADESALHAEIGSWHLKVIRAAFQCDLIRVATFQWAPGQSGVAFKGMVPNDPEGIFRHHPMSHTGLFSSSTYGGPPPTGEAELRTYEFMTNVQTWYNDKMADALLEFKTATDGFGANVLDQTIIPFVTEISDGPHARNALPAIIFGGRTLGMQGGQFQDVTGRPHNDLWATIAQAYLKTSDPLSAPALANEVFVRAGVAPIAGLWTLPT